jgi:RES domain-containing protein
MRLWRITQERFAGEAFSGVGSARVDGRWHTRNVGVPVVYTSTSVPLAMMELLVNASRHALEHTRFVQIPVEVPDDIAVLEVSLEDIERLDKEWRSYAPYGQWTQLIGNAWLQEGTSVLLRVPSAVMAGDGGERDFNVLINPRHDDFKRLVIGDPTHCPLDTRLFRRD